MPDRGRGRIFRPKGRNVLMIAYWGPRADGSMAEIRESAKTENEAEARKLLDTRLREVANHREGLKPFGGPSAERLTVGELLDALERDYESRQIKGLRVAKAQMQHLRDAFTPLRALSLTTDTVRRYVDARRAAKKSNATINRETEHLTAAFRLAIRERRLAAAPWIPRLSETGNVRRGFFEKDELEAILRHLPGPLDAAARFAYLYGWRENEIRLLRWDSVDRNAREIRLYDTKSGEGRSLPLDDGGWALIEMQWSAREFTTCGGASGLSPWVFHRQGKPVDTTTWGRQWRTARVAAKLPGKLFHDLRRTAIRNMVRAGVPETIAMKISGHRTRSIFDRYNITDERDKLKAVEATRAFVESQPAKSNVSSFPGKSA